MGIGEDPSIERRLAKLSEDFSSCAPFQYCNPENRTQKVFANQRPGDIQHIMLDEQGILKRVRLPTRPFRNELFKLRVTKDRLQFYLAPMPFSSDATAMNRGLSISSLRSGLDLAQGTGVKSKQSCRLRSWAPP